MPRFAANLSLLFTERPLTERFGAARRAGFEAVELLFPYEMPAEALAQALRDNDLTLALINTPAGNWAAGERGCAALPDHGERFRREFEQALHYAQICKTRHIHVMAGIAQGLEAEKIFAENLHWANRAAPEQSLLVEPINPIDMPGYFLNSFDQAVHLLARLNTPGIRLQFDAYHAHRILGDVLSAWQSYGPFSAHVQIAGFPGRHEPIGGDIDYPAFLRRLDAEGYPGFVSGEYFPAGPTEAGLSWLGPARGQTPSHG